MQESGTKQTGRPRNTVDTFWSRVDQSGGIDACWNWTFGCDDDGYGLFHINNRMVRCHRFAYETTKGPLEHGALHTCDNRRCCNPRHIYDGTVQDNMRDCKQRGRTGGLKNKGCHNGGAKLKGEQVVEIRRIRQRTGMSITELGSIYGVDSHTIWEIIIGRSWKESQYQIYLGPIDDLALRRTGA